MPGLPAAASARAVPYSLSAAGHRVAGTASAACATSRRHSGTILYSGIRGGLGRLTIRNRLSRDAVIVLVRGRSKAIGVYVRAHASTTVRNIKDGTYTIYFTIGSLFRACTGRFTRGASYWRVKHRLPFVSPPRFTVATLTLIAVKGGNSPTTPISPKGFPSPWFPGSGARRDRPPAGSSPASSARHRPGDAVTATALDTSAPLPPLAATGEPPDTNSRYESATCWRVEPEPDVLSVAYDLPARQSVDTESAIWSVSRYWLGRASSWLWRGVIS
jgi:hypothetical protein